jgi:hypothetical protein
MALQTIKIGNTPYASPYYSVGKEECVNLYVENAISETSLVPYYYISIPGLKLFSQKSSTKVSRGIFRTSNNRLFSVNGNELVEILSTGQKLTRGTIGTYSGTVSFADNTHQLCFVDGQSGYILDFASNDFSQIDSETFQNGATHVTCIDTYFIVNRPNSIYYNWSKPNNGLTWDPLDFASKEGMPDDIVALKECSNQLWVFGNYSTEVHYDTADTSTQVWQRYEGAVIDIGCAAKYSVARLENHIFWVGSDKTGNIAVWTNDGLQPAKISTRGIEQLIIHEVGQQNVSNCIGFTYSQAGHIFYLLTFPNSDLTIAFDITTKTWHRRSSLDSTGKDVKWRAQYSTFVFGKNLFADNSSDALYEADVEYYVNDLPEGGTAAIKRVRTSPVIQANRKRVRHNSLQLIFEQGVGLNDNTALGFGITPKCLLYTSDDSGISYSNVREAELGKIGEYEFRTRFLCLGHSRSRVYKIVVTDPVKVIFIGMIADLEELRF